MLQQDISTNSEISVTSQIAAERFGCQLLDSNYCETCTKHYDSEQADRYHTLITMHPCLSQYPHARAGHLSLDHLVGDLLHRGQLGGLDPQRD